MGKTKYIAEGAPKWEPEEKESLQTSPHPGCCRKNLKTMLKNKSSYPLPGPGNTHIPGQERVIE
jgi:hypothetical protein